MWAGLSAKWLNAKFITRWWTFLCLVVGMEKHSHCWRQRIDCDQVLWVACYKIVNMLLYSLYTLHINNCCKKELIQDDKFYFTSWISIKEYTICLNLIQFIILEFYLYSKKEVSSFIEFFQILPIKYKILLQNTQYVVIKVLFYSIDLY